MKKNIESLLEHAEFLYEELRSAGEASSRYKGEQLTEAKTEKQLDRWTRERGLDESIETAVANMAKVLDELRWIHEGFEK